MPLMEENQAGYPERDNEKHWPPEVTENVHHIADAVQVQLSGTKLKA